MSADFVPTIGVAMIVKNEESCIRTCLDSLKDIDEICVIDTGSEDSTPEILRSYPNVTSFIGEYKWNDDFAEARNLSIAKVKSQWVLIIDADEWLEPGGIAKAKAEIMKHQDAKVLGFKCVSRNGVSVHPAPRLFRNGRGIKYNGAIHNHLSKLADVNVDVVITYGYSDAHKKDPDRALRILTKVVDANPNAAREIFYLAREYVYRSQWQKALELYQRYLTIASWGPEIAEAHLAMARIYVTLKQFTLARESCLKAINVNADFGEALRMMASMSGPKNKVKWEQFSKLATDQDVLFIRSI